MAPYDVSHDPAVPGNGKNRPAYHVPDTVLLQKQAVKSRTQIGCLEAVHGIFFLKEPITCHQGTTKACRRKIPVTGCVVVMPVASHCNVHLFRPDSQPEGIFQGVSACSEVKEDARIPCLHIKGQPVFCFHGLLFPGQIVHDSHYLDNPHLLRVYKILIIFMK